jgi:DNA-directed RNA polymerase subunit H (RpoH/RPB5)
MSKNSNLILSLYKSRLTIVELLEYQGYDIKNYMTFSINEIDAMYKNSQLDFLVNHENNNTKTYIKYFLQSKQIKPNVLDEMIDELFHIESVLTKNDTLLIIVEDEPNDTIITKIKYLYDKMGIFVVLHRITRLQFNILNHNLVPKCEILDDEEVQQLQKTYNITDIKKIPEISRFDPQALAMSLRPGQICKFERNSATSMNYTYYRICI